MVPSFHSCDVVLGCIVCVGTAVYLFGVTAQAETAELSFVLDNGVPVNFDLSTVSLSSDVQYIYNALLFGSSNLASGQHTLSWTLTSITGSDSFASAPVHVALIDYAIVTSNDASPLPSSMELSALTDEVSTTLTIQTQTDFATLYVIPCLDLTQAETVILPIILAELKPSLH